MTPPNWATRSVNPSTLAQPGALLGLGDTMHTRALQELQMRAAESDDGTFEGYACVWDTVDSYGTTFRQGCFTEGGLDQAAYALLWMHDPLQPIGTFTAAEDSHGLLIKGGWDDTPEGQAKRSMARGVKGRPGSAPGLSVGFVPVGVDPDDETAFTSCRLVETSQITLRMASVPGAAITKARVTAPADQLRADADRAVARLRLALPVRR